MKTSTKNDRKDIITTICIPYGDETYSIVVKVVKDETPAKQCNMIGQKIEHLFKLVENKRVDNPNESFEHKEKKKSSKKQKRWKSSMIYDSKDFDAEFLKECVFTLKVDGRNAAIINGKLYVRQDLKISKDGKFDKAPEGWIACQTEPSGTHWPHLRPAEKSKDKWEIWAFENLINEKISFSDGSYEIIGENFQGNPHHINTKACFSPHGTVIFEVPEKLRTFEGVKKILELMYIEGFVLYHLKTKQIKKVRRDGFGFTWPIQGRKSDVIPYILGEDKIFVKQ